MSFRQKINSNVKKEKPQSTSDSSAWLVSFADLLSLILTFFVLVYSMSEMPQKKWTQYSSSIVEYITGNKINFFKQELKVTEKSKTKKLDAHKVSNLTYLKTLLEGMEVDGTPMLEIVNYKITNNEGIIEMNKEYFTKNNGKIEMNEKATLIFLSLSKIFQKVNNQMLLNYPSKDYVESAEFSDFIARKVEEFGYEYKVLRGVYYYNANLLNEEINNNFQIVIKINEALF